MNHHLKHVLFMALGLLALVLVMQLASADAEAVTTYVWDGEGADALASTADNWYENVDGAITDNVAPTTNGNIVFNDTSTKSCTWDVSLELGTFSINSGYTGTITQSSDMYITGFTINAGVFTGGISTNKKMILFGDYILNGGTVTPYSVHLQMIKDNSKTLGGANGYWLPLQVSAKNVTVHSGAYIASLIVDNNCSMLVGTFSNSNVHWLAGYNANYYIQNNGEIKSPGRFIVYFNTVDRANIDVGYVERILFRTAGTANRVVSIIDTNVQTFEIDSIGSYTLTVDLNGHNLTASSITVGTRGILKNTALTDSTITANSITVSGTSSFFDETHILFDKTKVIGQTLTWSATAATTASNASAWSLLRAPFYNDNIVFSGVSVFNCNWNVAIDSLGTFSINSGYTGTITQSSDMHILGYSQEAATFDGANTKWVYCSGDFTQSAGTITLNKLRLQLIGINKNFTVGTSAIHSLVIKNDTTIKFTSTYAWIVDGYFQLNDGAELTIDSNKKFVIYYPCYTNVNTILNGTFKGLTNSIIEFQTPGNYNLPNLSNCKFENIILQFNIAGSSTNNYKMILTSSINSDKINIYSQHATYTCTLDLNGYNLTAQSITVGIRGILTNSQSTGIVTCSAFTQSGASSQVTANIELYCSGTLTISDGVFTQGADLHIGGFSMSGGTFTGIDTKWVYCSGNGNWTKSSGTFTNFVTRIYVEDTLIINSQFLLHSTYISGTLIINHNSVYSYISTTITSDGELIINSGKILIVYTPGTIINGNVNGSGELIISGNIASITNGPIITGLIADDITVRFYTDSSAGNRIITAIQDYNINKIVISSSHATNTITLDLNGHNLTAQSITVGTRGILQCGEGTITTNSLTATAGTIIEETATWIFTGTGNINTAANKLYDAQIQGVQTLLSNIRIANHLGITGSLVQGAYRVNVTSSIAECLSITGEFSGSIYLDGDALTYRPTVQIPHGGTIYTNRQTVVLFTEGEFRVNPTGWVNLTVLTWNVRNVNEEASFHLGGTSGNCEVELLIVHDRTYYLWIDNSTSLYVGRPMADIIAFDWSDWSSHFFVLNPAPIFMSFPDEFGVCFERYYYDADVNENATLSAAFDSPDLRFDNASGVLQGRLIQNHPVITVSIRADDGYGGVTYLNYTIDVDMLYWNIRATIGIYEYGSLKVGFNFTSTTPSDLIVSVIWNFGDGTGSKGFEGVHEYKKDGYYWVTLIVKDINGNVGRESYYLKVGNPAPNNVEPPSQDDFGPLYDLVLKLIGIGALALVTVAVYEAIKRGRMNGNQAILLFILLFGMTIALFVSVIMGVF